MIFNNYAFQSVSDKGKTQAPLHSRFARVGEYPLSSSSLHFLTRILLSQNSTKLNIKRNNTQPSYKEDSKLNKGGKDNGKR